MKLRHLWPLALLSILTLMLTTTVAVASETMTKGRVELGVSGIKTEDSPARVNEYVGTRDEKGFSLAPKLSLETISNGSTFELDVDANGPRDQKFDLEVDAKRIFKLDISHDVLEHWKDHDTLEHLGATFRNDTASNQPRVTTDATVGQVSGAGVPEAGALERYNQELSNKYIVTRKETEAETSLTLPALPNITFHAGLRVETREGLEQATTLSKCSQCHVQANGKTIDERTTDRTLGLTGKFGLATIEYEFMTREFTENASSPAYNYLTTGATRAGITDDSQLLYSGSQAYKITPDSDKDTHDLKVRVDINRDSSVSAAYVKSEVESKKSGQAGIYSLDKSSLSSKYESFFLKGATRIGALRLTARGGTYEIDGPESTMTLIKPTITTANNTFTNPRELHSAESREVREFAINGVYRLAPKTTLRVGIEREEVDRDEKELGETETNTFKLAIKTRFNKKFSARASYKYEDIEDPFGADHATGIAQVTGTTDPNYPGLAWMMKAAEQFINGNPASGAVYYWNSVYPSRELSATNKAENVHEGKVSTTWKPAANMAATIFARVRMEENDSVDYKQDTYVPGVSFYYAPTSKLNLSMAYTFNKQDTENRMCVGWYHG